ncbi:MAG: DUF559 domain-containing protein, partial [Clostridia bacterium]|nr:DUF559 domain-containing protein [Clostridia bacterium]
IELDGSQHYSRQGEIKDAIRTSILEDRNMTVMRIPNNEINQRFADVCQYIDHTVRTAMDIVG